MSSGVVVCSACRREVHQDGPPAWPSPGAALTWRHCEDKTPRCAGAHSAFPASPADIVGRWCGMDQTPGQFGGGALW
jgi:hypothetical protein